VSIRTKLTIWYTSVLALVLVAFGVGLYLIQTVMMLNQLEDSLRTAANSAQIVFRTRGTTAPVASPSGLPSRTLLPDLDPFSRSQLFVELISVDKKIIAVSSNLAGEDGVPAEPLDLITLQRLITQAAPTSTDVYGTVRTSSTAPALYVLTRQINGSDDKPVGFIQVGSSMQMIESAQRVLFVTLLVLGTLGLLISSVLGAFLARRALRPVDRITQTALAIYRAENLDQRVPTTNAEDEVGRLGAAFNEMLDRLSRLFTAQQRLVADVSHEMRTPLTVIRGNVDLLNAMGCADIESLEALKRESDRMTRMVGDLLLLSQADSGQMPMHLQPTGLGPLIADVERSGRVLAGDRKSITAVCDPSVIVMADADRLKQVLLNLTDNAIKHTPAGGTVHIEASGPFNGFARISVADSGQGIPEADLPHIFERFYRVDKSRSRERGGSGLGLSIAQKIVEAHRGRITASSKIGVGTTFDVFIPLHVETPQQPIDPPKPTPTGRRIPLPIGRAAKPQPGLIADD
jgi:two-component system, OmpR family, sensor kinase